MPDFSEDVVECVARAICISYGYDPDDDAPVEVVCGPNNEYVPLWCAYEEQATAALAAAWEWKPIETAPRDGTRFLACFLKNRYEQIFPIAWSENVYDDGFGWTLDDGESAVLTYDRPTHWMPLPPPPEAHND